MSWRPSGLIAKQFSRRCSSFGVTLLVEPCSSICGGLLARGSEFRDRSKEGLPLVQVHHAVRRRSTVVDSPGWLPADRSSALNSWPWCVP
eukprot:988921-Amphidinium_carterae.1